MTRASLGYKALPTVASLPTASSTYKGVFVVQTSNNHTYFCDGTQWIDYTQALTVFAAGVNSGLVPDPGSATGKFLKDSSTWAIPLDPRLLVAVTTSTTTNATTTLANATGLSVALLANKTYMVRANVLFQMSVNNQGIRLAVGALTGATVTGMVITPNNSSTPTFSSQRATGAGAATPNIDTANATTLATMNFQVQMGSTAGSFQVQFCSSNTSATASVMTGSSIEAIQVN